MTDTIQLPDLDEGKKIADNGYQTYNEKYSARHFWNNIFNKLNEKN